MEEHRCLVAKVNSPYLCADNIQIIRGEFITIYRPRDESCISNGSCHHSTIFFLPGTAFVARETSFTDVICSYISSYSKSQVICIKNKLAPEFKFPYSHLDAYRIFKETLELAEQYSIDKSRVAIMGYSSGGNFAALLSILASKEGIKLTRQILISPCLDLSRSIPDFKDNEDQDNAITESFVTWFLNQYIPAKIDRKDPKVSPLWANKEDLQKLPPTDIVVADHDRFRGDSEVFADKLNSAGVLVGKYKMKGDHSFLWFDMEVSKFIGIRMKYIFNNNELEHPLPLENNLIFVFRTKKKSAEKQGKEIYSHQVKLSLQQIITLFEILGITFDHKSFVKLLPKLALLK
jgi:acetyl esterase/lipase